MHRVAGVTTPSSTSKVRAKYWVLSRGLYATRLLPLADIPPKRQQGAIQLALAAWTPFADTAHHVIVEDNVAILCAWDRAMVNAAQAASNVDADTSLEATLTVIPESALREIGGLAKQNAPGMPGVKFAAMLDGVSSLVINAGRVIDEQWWPTMPSANEWRNAQRRLALGATTTDVPNTPDAFAWRRMPMGYAGGQTVSTTSSREWLMVAFAAWLLAIPTIWLANDWRQIVVGKRDAEVRLAQTEKELDATLSSRGLALSSLARVEKLAAIFGQPDSFMLFAQVNEVIAQVVKAGTLQLVDWDYRDQRVKMTMAAPNGGAPAATALVVAFEKVPTWRDVQVNADGNRLRIEFNIVPADTPATTGNATTSGGINNAGSK